MPQPIIAVASSASVMDADEDQAVVAEALRQAGCAVELWAWDDPTVAWSSADLVVIRSTWDYAERRDEFCAWAEAVGGAVALHNGSDVVRWNTDKHYLAELDAGGIEVTPTTWLEPGDEVVLPASPEVVVKPTISAGSQDTTRHRLDHGDGGAVASARALLDRGRPVMVQPYLQAVDGVGETGLVYIDGVFHHAFRKGPILVEGQTATERLYAPEAITATDATDAQRALAERTLSAAPFEADGLLYSRVDVAPGPDGSPMLMELELVEPSLFFVACGCPATALADAVVRRL